MAILLISVAAPACAFDGIGGGGGSGGGGDAAGDGGSRDAPMATSRVEDLVRGDVYSHLVLEVDYVDGFAPRPQVVSDIGDDFTAILDKPDGVEAVLDHTVESRGSDHAWTGQEIVALSKQEQDLPLDDVTTSVHVLFVDGHSADDTGGSVILGVAYGNDRLVIFEQTIENTCRSGLVPPTLTESLCASAELAIWTHELGHVIGLVDNGLPVVEDHRDPDHGAHDSSDQCVMYWAYDGGSLVDSLASDLIGGNSDKMSFDAACLADVAALRD